METNTVKSCKNCFCQEVCKHISRVIASFEGAARNCTNDFIEDIHKVIDVSMAKECKKFSSIDDQDFKRLEAENKRLLRLISDMKDVIK